MNFFIEHKDKLSAAEISKKAIQNIEMWFLAVIDSKVPWFNKREILRKTKESWAKTNHHFRLQFRNARKKDEKTASPEEWTHDFL